VYVFHFAFFHPITVNHKDYLFWNLTCTASVLRFECWWQRD